MFIRRNFDGIDSDLNSVVEPSTVKTSNTVQDNPTLEQLLVMYQRGVDIDGYIHPQSPSDNRVVDTSNIARPVNRVGRVDPLTETQDFVRETVRNAQEKLSAEQQVAQSKKMSEMAQNNGNMQPNAVVDNTRDNAAVSSVVNPSQAKE